MGGLRIQLDEETSDILKECKEIYFSQDDARRDVGVSWPKLLKIIFKYYRDN